MLERLSDRLDGVDAHTSFCRRVRSAVQSPDRRGQRRRGWHEVLDPNHSVQETSGAGVGRREGFGQDHGPIHRSGGEPLAANSMAVKGMVMPMATSLATMRNGPSTPTR